MLFICKSISVNYARYDTYYINDMYGLPEEINNKLKKGCMWQGYLLDTSIEFGQIPMLVETTLMKFPEWACWVNTET